MSSKVYTHNYKKRKTQKSKSKSETQQTKRKKKRESACVPAEMVAHKIRVFGEIDGLEGEPPEALTAVDSFVLCGGGASATWLRSPLPVHCDVLDKTLLLLCSLVPQFRKGKLVITNPKPKSYATNIYYTLSLSLSLSLKSQHTVSLFLSLFADQFFLRDFRIFFFFNLRF